MKRSTKKSSIKKSSDDALTEQGNRPPSQSSEDFSVVDIPFNSNSYSESKDKMGIYLESLATGPATLPKSHILERAIELNNLISPKLFLDEIVDLYNTIVLYGKPYLKDLHEEVVEQTLSFGELITKSFPKARYIIEPFFEQGTVNMISAPPNTWKSWLLFYFSAHIAQGTKPFDKFETEQSKVMIVNEEDSFRAIQDRFKILGVTDVTLPIFFRVANGSKLESKFIDKLILELQEKQIKVVIFDSLRSMHEADENDSTAMQIILDQMKRIAREGVTVIFTHHHRKKGPFEKGSNAESSRGSSAINAAISGHLSLEEEERETGLYLVVRHLKSKAGEKLSPFELKIMKTERKVEFVYDGEFKQAEKKLKQTKDEIMATLADGKWKSVKQLEESITVSKTIMRQALTSLKSNGIILAIDRRQAISKSIPVALKGNAREFYYSINNESSELIIQENEQLDQDEIFNNY